MHGQAETNMLHTYSLRVTVLRHLAEPRDAEK